MIELIVNANLQTRVLCQAQNPSFMAMTSTYMIRSAVQTTAMYLDFKKLPPTNFSVCHILEIYRQI